MRSLRNPRNRRPTPRCWRLAGALVLTLALAGCDALHEQSPGELVVRSAHVIDGADGASLELALDCKLSDPMREALDRGIPLILALSVRSDAIAATDGKPAAPTQVLHRRIEMRYFALSRRYQLRDPDNGHVLRSVAAPAYLFDALTALRLPLDPAFSNLPRTTRLHLTIGLDRAALPGALRLPSMFELSWHLRAPEFTWSLRAG